MTPQPLTDAEFDSLSGVLSRYGGKDAVYGYWTARGIVSFAVQIDANS
jgi:hypothetical protein